MKNKICNFCKIRKSFKKLHKSPSGKFGLKGKCNDCVKEYNLKIKKKISQYHKKYRAKYEETLKNKRKLNYKNNKKRDSERSRWYSIKRNYNLNKEQYIKMFKKQLGLCLICNKKETKKDIFGEIKWLSVDHCHKTEKVRGLLCQTCNHGLGMFYDNIKSLKNAIQYLVKNG